MIFEDSTVQVLTCFAVRSSSNRTTATDDRANTVCVIRENQSLIPGGLDIYHHYLFSGYHTFDCHLRYSSLGLVGYSSLEGAFGGILTLKYEARRAVSPREPIKNSSCNKGEPCWDFKDLSDLQNKLTRLSSHQWALIAKLLENCWNDRSSRNRLCILKGLTSPISTFSKSHSEFGFANRISVRNFFKTDCIFLQ